MQLADWKTSERIRQLEVRLDAVEQTKIDDVQPPAPTERLLRRAIDSLAADVSERSEKMKNALMVCFTIFCLFFS